MGAPEGSQLCTGETRRTMFSRIVKLIGAGGAGSEVWNRVYMIAPVKKFGRVRLSANFPSKQIWRRTQSWKDNEFLLVFKFYGVQT